MHRIDIPQWAIDRSLERRGVPHVHENLGPFPDFTGKGRFADANSYQRTPRIWLAVGYEPAR